MARNGNKESNGLAAGTLVGAAMAGAAVGMVANVGRKLFVQFGSAATGDWLDAIKAEHKLALAIFDKIEATSDKQTTARTSLLGKLKYALTKHAHEEESVLYPALREAARAGEADLLTSEHGYVKTYLYELETLPKDDPSWLPRVRDFRSMIEEHMRMEETEIFPSFRELMSDEQNARLTARVNREGFKMA
jgi:hemerythrin superfamily protein